MPAAYENKQHMHAAIQEMKRAKLLEEIEEMCSHAQLLAQTEKNLRKIMALHARCKALASPRATVNNNAERARKREFYHRRRRQTLESKDP